MGAHHYAVINESDDVKEEFRDEAPQIVVVPVTIAWWKHALWNLLAAAVGAGFMFLVTYDSSSTQITQPTQPSTSAAAVIAVSTITSTATITATATTTVTADLALHTSPSEDTKQVIKTTSQNPLAGHILDCGHSPEEAREKGCIYDVMMQDWVPEPCYDSVLTEKYLAEGNWTWYADGDGKTTLTDEEMRKGEHGEAWMSTSYHKAHCVFSWLKIVRALRNGEGISEELLSYDHVLHCKHGALKANPDHEDLGVKAPTNYPRCALYEDWKLDFVPDKHSSEEK